MFEKECSENSIYQDLNDIMRIFRKIFDVLYQNLIEDIQGINNESSIKTNFIDINEQLNTKAQKFATEFPLLITNQNFIISRFVGRLAEIVNFYASKSPSIQSESIRLFCQGVYNLLLQLKKNFCLNSFLKKLVAIVKIRFFYNSKNVTHKIKKWNKKSNSKALQDKLQPLQEPFKLEKLKIKSQSQQNIKKIIQSFNVRFNSLIGMDLDYYSSRSLHFALKSNTKNQDNYFDDCLSRNYLICGAITEYKKNYQQYLRRKQVKKAIKQKNKLLGNQSQKHFSLQKDSITIGKKPNKFVTNSNGPSSPQKRQTVRLQTTHPQQFQQRVQRLLLNVKTKNKKDAIYSSNKQQMSLKSVSGNGNLQLIPINKKKEIQKQSIEIKKKYLGKKHSLLSSIESKHLNTRYNNRQEIMTRYNF